MTGKSEKERENAIWNKNQTIKKYERIQEATEKVEQYES